MRVAVLGSGSRGNAIALEADGRTLLVDAGFGVRSLARRAVAARIPLNRLVGIVVTHEHNDHARGAAHLARRRRSTVYGSRGTLQAMAGQLRGIATTPLEPHEPAFIGPFTVCSCHIMHDAAEPLAVTVEITAFNQKLGVAYDVGRPTAALRQLLRGCDCLIIEANHDDVMLRTGPYPAVVQQRIAGSRGHLSNRAAAALLAELCHEGLETVVLAHLSDQCNRAALATATVRHTLVRCGFRGKIVVATQETPTPPFHVQALGEQRWIEGFG